MIWRPVCINLSKIEVFYSNTKLSKDQYRASNKKMCLSNKTTGDFCLSETESNLGHPWDFTVVTSYDLFAGKTQTLSILEHG